MGWLQSLHLLTQFVSRPIRGVTHADRLESFYGYQAQQYDDFRKPFLRGRDELAARLPFTPGTRWCDLGCGTGYMLEAAGQSARACAEIQLVDLCPSLLALAQKRVDSGGWTNAATIHADTTEFTSRVDIDVVTFSYSLSMIPNWFTAIDRAFQMLRPGGLIGVVDFYVGQKHRLSLEHRQHSWRTRHFWPAWFDIDNVRPNADLIPYLNCRFEVQWLNESRTSVPFMPWFRPPYFAWIGKKVDR